jgi:hypothetical protein
MWVPHSWAAFGPRVGEADAENPSNRGAPRALVLSIKSVPRSQPLNYR